MSKIDYTKFSDQGPLTPKGAVDQRWWLANKSDRAASVAAVIQTLSDFDTVRRDQYELSARLYGNTSLVGLKGVSLSQMKAPAAAKDRMTFNLVQSGIDTITAKITKNKPKPMFLTSGGDYKMQRKAKKLEKFVEGVFYENKAYERGPEAFRDAAVIGDGFIHVFDHYDRVKWERVLASELYVDWIEAFYGEPRQLHRVKNVDRQVLLDLFPGKRALILEADSTTSEQTGALQNVSDQVQVFESWHLRSGPEAKDGLHTINIASGTLFEEDWEKDFFPFAQIQWNKRLYGFFAQSAPEQVQSIQLEINRILFVMQRSYQLGGSFKIWTKTGAKIVKSHLNNEIGLILESDEMPQYLVPPIVQPEMYGQLDRLINRGYEQLGVSQLSASSQKPAGLDSGKALREYNDIESDRFRVVGQAYENLFMQLTQLSVSVARDIYQRKRNFSVKVPGRKFIETIDWKAVDMEDDEYILKIFPVSSLPNDPAGRMQTVQEYVQAGWISNRAGKRLMDFPDLEQADDLMNAEDDYLHMILEKIVDEGIYTAPEPYDDLVLAREMALEYYAQGKRNALEEEKLDQLRQFLDALDLLAQKAMPPQPMMGAPMAPQANPAAPPVSDLIPNVPEAMPVA